MPCIRAIPYKPKPRNEFEEKPIFVTQNKY